MDHQHQHDHESFFGFTFQQICKVFVISDLVLAIVGTGLVLGFYGQGLVHVQTFRGENGTHFHLDVLEHLHDENTDNRIPMMIAKYWYISYIVITPLLLLAEIYLFVLLRSGVHKKNYEQCKRWFRLRLCILDLPLIYFFSSLIKWGAIGGMVGIPLVVGILDIMYRGFQLSILQDFMYQIDTRNRRPLNGIQPNYHKLLV